MAFYDKKDCVSKVLHMFKPRLHVYAHGNKKRTFLHLNYGGLRVLLLVGISKDSLLACEIV